MDSNAPFKISIAFEASNKATVIIRLKNLSERGGEPLKPESDMERGFGKLEWFGHPYLWEQLAKSCKAIKSTE